MRIADCRKYISITILPFRHTDCKNHLNLLLFYPPQFRFRNTNCILRKTLEIHYQISFRKSTSAIQIFDCRSSQVLYKILSFHRPFSPRFTLSFLCVILGKTKGFHPLIASLTQAEFVTQDEFKNQGYYGFLCSRFLTNKSLKIINTTTFMERDLYYVIKEIHRIP